MSTLSVDFIFENEVFSQPLCPECNSDATYFSRKDYDADPSQDQVWQCEHCGNIFND